MSPVYRLQALAVAFLVNLVASHAHAAVACTINGTVSLQPQDSFYCDTNLLGSESCANWKEVDLDTTTKPLQYMWITVDPVNGAPKSTRTDSAGNWSLTVDVDGSTCVFQQVDILYKFARLSESGSGFIGGFPNYRFRLVDVDEGDPMIDDDGPGNALHTRIDRKTLTVPTTTIPLSFSRTSTIWGARLANIYYTANSMLKEVTTWSANLDDKFVSTDSNEILRIGLENTWNGGGRAGGHGVIIGWDRYGIGGIIRHEIGHIVHGYVHHEDRNAACGGYAFREAVCTGGVCLDPRECEYGSTATSEALATFFGVRSLTTNDEFVWACSCFDGAIGGENWDTCSENALNTFDDDGDWFRVCTVDGEPGDGTFWYIGDFRSFSPASCVRLNKDGGCPCGGTSAECPASFRAAAGWRNGAQITRFLWDLIDTSTDGGQDNDNFGITDIVATLEAMPCIGNHNGEDGSCEEQATSPCDPPDPGGPLPSGPSPNRDSYNVYDLSEALPGSQENERILNCVNGAPD